MVNLGNMSISDLRLGATQVKAAYLGSEQVWSGSGPTPPTPSMTHVEYIESTGLEYIDTGIDGRSVYDLEFKFMAPADVAQTQWANLLAGASDNFTLGFWDTSNTEYFLRWRTLEKIHAASAAAGVMQTLAISGSTATFAGTSYNLGSASAVATQAGNIMICTNTSLSRIAKIRIYGLKLYDSSSNLLRDLVPVRVDNVGYLYDNVSNTLFGNSGSGEFIIGPDANWLCFTAEQASSTVHLDKNGSPNAISLETSTDGSTWTDYSWSSNTGDTLTLANVGDKVYMRAKTQNWTIGSGDSNYYQFKMTGRIASSGNIQTLLKSSGDVYTAPRYCYRNIFKGCTSLTTAPELPATTLLDHCYMDAFNGCTALTATPELPATTLGTYCYQGTFSGCTSLTKVAALPATTLATFCYCWMFGNCKSLTTAPELLATTVVDGCYENMFNGCRSLSSIVVAFSNWPSHNTNWLNGVASSGTFTCPAALPNIRGASNIPSGWTKVDAA